MTKLIHVVRKAGTVNCEVRFPLTKAQMKIVRDHYGRHDCVLQFGGRAEVYEQGNGWYVAWSMNDVVDGALRAVEQIEAALRIHAERMLAESMIDVVKGTTVTHVEVMRDNSRRSVYFVPAPTRFQRAPKPFNPVLRKT